MNAEKAKPVTQPSSAPKNRHLSNHSFPQHRPIAADSQGNLFGLTLITTNPAKIMAYVKKAGTIQQTYFLLENYMRDNTN